MSHECKVGLKKVWIKKSTGKKVGENIGKEKIGSKKNVIKKFKKK